MRTIYYITALSFLIFYSGCSDQIIESTPSIVQILPGQNVFAKFSDIQNKVFNKSCALSGCHVAGVQSPDLSSNAYDVIVNKPSTSGLNYIQPGNLSRSYIYLKLTNATNISGAQMPKNSPPLQQSVIDSIGVWIVNGALDN